MFLAPSDYTSISEVLTFSSTVTRESVVIAINDDETNENIEEFIASLTFDGTVVGGITLRPDRATVEIMDNDGML